MFPSQTQLYLADGLLLQSITGREFILREIACSYRPNIVIGQACLVVPAPARNVLNEFRLIARRMRLVSVLTALCDRICAVVSVCTEKQMRWLNAVSSIAFMANAEPIWYRPVGERPRNAMHKEVLSLNSHFSVAGVFVCRSGPDAAAGWRKKIAMLLKTISGSNALRHGTSTKVEKAGERCSGNAALIDACPGQTKG